MLWCWIGVLPANDRLSCKDDYPQAPCEPHQGLSLQGCDGAQGGFQALNSAGEIAGKRRWCVKWLVVRRLLCVTFYMSRVLFSLRCKRCRACFTQAAFLTSVWQVSPRSISSLLLPSSLLLSEKAIVHLCQLFNPIS